MPPKFDLELDVTSVPGISVVPGNAPDLDKLRVTSLMARICGHTPKFTQGFMLDVARKLILTDVSVRPKRDEISLKEYVVKFEILVDEGVCIIATDGHMTDLNGCRALDMSDGLGTLHIGCATFLIDVCVYVAVRAVAYRQLLMVL
jgi:hypothetical protein